MIEKIKKLYFKYEEIINYLIIGVFTTIVSLGSYLLFANTLFSAKSDLDIQIANVLSWICAVIFAYITNRIFVFKSKTEGEHKVKETINFVGSRFASLLVDMGLMYVLFSLMHMNDGLAKVLVQIVVVVMNYVVSKVFVFKKVDKTK